MPVFKRYTRRPKLKAKDIMSSPPVTIRGSETIVDAAKLMREKGVGSLIVVDPQGRIKGIITERDVLNSLAAGKACAGGRVEEVMSRNLIVARPEEDLDIVVERMREANIRHIPVVDEEGKPVGMISVRDLIDLGISAFKLFVDIT